VAKKVPTPKTTGRKRQERPPQHHSPPRPEWKSALRRFGEELRRVYGKRLRGVFLYGSRARGDATPESDIDTLVLLATCEDFWTECKRISPVASRVSLDHDVVISAMPVDADGFAVDPRPVIVNARREGRMIR